MTEACERAWHALRAPGERLLGAASFSEDLTRLGAERPSTGALLESSLEDRWVAGAHSMHRSVAVRVLVTPLGFPDNWFSHWHEQEQTVCISTHAWDRISSVALEGDTAFIGASYADGQAVNSGAVYVFRRSGGVWNQEAKLIASDGVYGDQFGSSVALAGDTAFIGAG